MADLLSKYCLSLFVIVVTCIVGAMARKRVVDVTISYAEMLAYAALSSFAVLCVVMLVNAAGFDLWFWDDLLLATSYIVLIPPKHLTRW